MTRTRTVRLGAFVVVGFAVVGVFVAMYFPYAEHRAALHALEHKAENLARLVAYTLRPAVEFADDAAIMDALAGLPGDVDFLGAEVEDPGGRVLARLGRPEHLEGRVLVESPIALSAGGSGALRLAMSTSRVETESAGRRSVSTIIGMMIALLGVAIAIVIERSVRRIRDLLAENERARAAAEQASEVKTRFLTNMSHEMRTPLNGVIGLADVLSRRRLDPETRDAVGSIARAGTSLLALVNDLLDLSRVEADRLDLESLPFDLERSVADVTAALLPTTRAKGVELTLEVDANVPSLVTGDPMRIGQVVTNLAGNAVKFTERGSVTVRVRRDGDRVVIDVRDTGIGIEPTKLESIFDPFTQADTSTTRRFGGSGLGLAISRRIAQAMGGTLTVESTVGVGSLFSFAFPAGHVRATLAFERPHGPVEVRAPAEAAERWRAQIDALGGSVSAEGPCLVWDPRSGPLDEPTLAGVRSGARRLIVVGPADPELPVATPHVRLGTVLTRAQVAAALAPRPGPDGDARARAPKERLAARVLLAEDDATNQLVATSFLRELGADYVLASDGREVLELLREGQVFDLILMDCQMPGLDGYGAARAIREAERATGSRVPILAVTAHALSTERDRALGAGMDALLTKPLTLASLRDAIQDLTPHLVVAAPFGDSTLAQPAMRVRLRDALRQTADETLPAIATALESRAFDAAAKHAHRVKGACMSVGDSAAAEAARHLEQALLAESADEATRSLLVLEVALADALDALAPSP